MKKVIDFIDSLTPSLYDLLGYPTIKVYSDFYEVIFTTHNVLRDLEVLELSSDEFRIFADENCSLCVVFTIYKS